MTKPQDRLGPARAARSECVWDTLLQSLSTRTDFLLNLNTSSWFHSHVEVQGTAQSAQSPSPTVSGVVHCCFVEALLEEKQALRVVLNDLGSRQWRGAQELLHAVLTAAREVLGRSRVDNVLARFEISTPVSKSRKPPMGPKDLVGEWVEVRHQIVREDNPAGTGPNLITGKILSYRKKKHTIDFSSAGGGVESLRLKCRLGDKGGKKFSVCSRPPMVRDMLQRHVTRIRLTMPCPV